MGLSPNGYERFRPIFDSGRTFHPISALVDWRVDDAGDALHLRLATVDGPDVDARITFADPHVVRFEWVFGGPVDEHVTEMLAGPPPRLAVTVDDDGETVRASAGGPAVELRRRPWRLAFGPYATEPGDTSLVEWVDQPGGWAAQPHDGVVEAYETWALAPGEQLWGGGERYLGPGLRGRRIAHWIDEPFGTNTTDLVYKSVPFVVSSRGYGLFFHHPERADLDLGARSQAAASVLVSSPRLDQFVVLGTPKEVIERYTALTGRPAVPPAWTYGIWFSRCMYSSRAEVASVIARARELDVPLDVVHLDPLWMRRRKDWPYDACDFEEDEEAFGPLEDLARWLHDQDVRLSLWVNPHVPAGDPSWVPDRLVDGGLARDPVFPTRGFVDPTSGAGRAWWLEQLRRLVALGVDAVKLDYGEVLPVDARLADGRRGAEVHNLYPMLFAEIAAEAGVPFTFTRSGTAGAQRWPLHWGGDSQSTWAGLAGALRGGLSLAWSGFAHWTSDVGGFFRRDLHRADDPDHGFDLPDTELYVRWLQFGMLCSHTRLHGQGPREPWAFGDEAVAVARTFAALRRRLVPYLQGCAEEAAAVGTPLLRPMAMEFPDDPTCRHLDTQYVLGPDLLVAPVLEPGGAVEYYVPAGSWRDVFTDEEVTGPRWRRETVPLERIPVLVRVGGRALA